MKVFLNIVLAIAFLVALISSATKVSRDDYYEVVRERDALQEQIEIMGSSSDVNVSEALNNAGIFQSSAVQENLNITEYQYSSDHGVQAILVVENNSDFDIKVSADAVFFDAENNLLGTESAYAMAVEAGTPTILKMYPDTPYAEMKYTLTVEEEDWYGCVISGLEVESVSGQSKEVVSITNNGKYPAKFVECTAMFFEGEELVGVNSHYFTDSDSELKKGKTITEEISCYRLYDSVQFYLTGRYSKD